MFSKLCAASLFMWLLLIPFFYQYQENDLKKKKSLLVSQTPVMPLAIAKTTFPGQCAANGEQPLSCARKQESLGTNALEFKIPIILRPHLVPPALVFRTPKGYRYPRLRTPDINARTIWHKIKTKIFSD